MYDQTRQHASTTTDRPRRQRSLTLRGLAATVLLFAAVPAAAWAVAHPATVAALALAAAAGYAAGRFAHPRGPRARTLRTTVAAALGPGSERPDGE